MADRSLLQEICESNQAFLAGAPRRLDDKGDPFVVVACIDPRLTDFLEPALGLPRHRAVVTRTAGNIISADCQGVLRSIAAAFYLKRGKEVFVVGHTDCALSKFSAAEVIDSFRGKGVPRSAFGNGDLRTWFGAFTDVKDNVIRSVNFLRRSGIVPVDTKIHGLVLGTEDGKLEIVIDGDVVRTELMVPDPVISQVTQVPMTRLQSIAEQAKPVAPPPLPVIESAGSGVVVLEPEPIRARPPQPTSMLEAARILSEVLKQERRKPAGQKKLTAISSVVRREKNPAIIFRELQTILNEYRDDYPKLPGAIEYINKYLSSKGFNSSHFMDILKRIIN